MNTKTIGVVGAGSWGTALANLLAGKGHDVTLWAYESEVVQDIKQNHVNHMFLPDIDLDPTLDASDSLPTVVAGKDLVLFVVPSHFFRTITAQCREFVGDRTLIVTASKGIENDTHLTMHGILNQTLDNVSKNRTAVLSGPSFAKEVARRLPTAVTVAAHQGDTALEVQKTFATPSFRVYTTDDMIGVELGGAVKNVVAIACGISDGMELGLNCRATLITRGLAELRRLGLSMGARPETFAGLAGLGDLVLTATGNLSRNYTFGTLVGKGGDVQSLIEGTRKVVEGYINTKTTRALAHKQGVDMPIAEAIYHILYEGLDPRKAVEHLMNRTLKEEIDQ